MEFDYWNLDLSLEFGKEQSFFGEDRIERKVAIDELREWMMLRLGGRDGKSWEKEN